MQIQINTDNHTDANEELIRSTTTYLEDKLDRFASRISRVEVQLRDENSRAKGGVDDKRCLLEVRLNGMQPVSTSDDGQTIDQALRGAVGKMQQLIESTLGKLGER